MFHTPDVANTVTGQFVVRPKRATRRGIYAASVVIAVLAGSTASAAGLASHQAVYDISLARPNSTFTELTGRLVYEVKGTVCTGYEQTMRFVTRSQNSEGIATLSDMRSNFTEPAGGKSFSFETENFRDKRQSERVVGDALKADGPELKLSLRIPTRKTLSFEEPTVFPVEHANALIASAIAGDRIFTANLYDGSDKGEKLFTVTAVIGGKLPPGHNAKLDKVESAGVLDGLAAWPVALSYLDQKTADSADGVPEYELSFLMFENGVSRRLLIDYGAFAIRGQLRSLEFHEAAPCN